MKMVRRPAIAAVILAIAACLPLAAEVTIIAKVPESGNKRGDAQWTGPRPTAEQVVAGAGTSFTGHLSTGWSGRSDFEGSFLNDISTDSNILLVQPLGAESLMRIGLDGLRVTNPLGTEQAYSGDFSLVLPKLVLLLSGGYEDGVKEEGETFGTHQTTAVSGSLATNLLPTLPMSLKASVERKDQGELASLEDDPNVTEAEFRASGDFSAAGTLGRLSVDLSGSLSTGDEKFANTRNDTAGGGLTIGYPISDRFAIEAEVKPSYTKDSYLDTGNESSSTALESALGIVFFPFDGFETGLYGGRTDTWATQDGPDADPDAPSYVASMDGRVAAGYAADAGFRANTSYTLKRAPEFATTHRGVLELGYGSDGVLRDLGGTGSIQLSVMDDGSESPLSGTWKTGFLIAPIQGMSLKAQYLGTANDSPVEENWQHSGVLALSQSVERWLELGVTGTLKEQFRSSDRSFTQIYDGRVALTPTIRLKTYRLSVQESFTREEDTSDPSMISVLSAGLGIPLFPLLQTQYSFRWEWVNLTEPGGSAGNNFLHTTGLSFGGGTLPIALSGEYAISHGYRGLMHNLSSQLTMSFTERLALRSTANYLEETDSGGTAERDIIVAVFVSYDY
jgi:hypothetical protein